jgi:hypothetical protein
VNVFRGIQRFFTHNVLLKLVSLIISFLLWGFLVLEKKNEVPLSIPLRVENVPASVVVTEPPPSEIRVVVRGRRSQLGAINDRILPYVIDLTGAKAGLSTFEVIPAKIALPRDLQIVHINPAQFDLRLAPVATKRLPVVVRFRGDLAPGFKLAAYRAMPEEISVTAAADELAARKVVETTPIDLSSLRGDQVAAADLDLTGLHVVDLTTHAVEVTLDVEESSLERTLADVPVALPAGARFAGRRAVTVTVRGPEEIVRALAPGALRAAIDPQPAGKRGRAAVRVTAPERVNVIRIAPAMLEVVF